MADFCYYGNLLIILTFPHFSQAEHISKNFVDGFFYNIISHCELMSCDDWEHETGWLSKVWTRSTGHPPIREGGFWQQNGVEHLGPN